MEDIMAESPYAGQSSTIDRLPSWINGWRGIALWSSLSAIAAVGTWQTARYWSRLLRQPALRVPEIPTSLHVHRALEAKAHAIAADNLRAGIESRHLPDGRR